LRRVTPEIDSAERVMMSGVAMNACQTLEPVYNHRHW